MKIFGEVKFAGMALYIYTDLLSGEICLLSKSRLAGRRYYGDPANHSIRWRPVPEFHDFPPGRTAELDLADAFRGRSRLLSWPHYESHPKDVYNRSYFTH